MAYLYRLIVVLFFFSGHAHAFAPSESYVWDHGSYPAHCQDLESPNAVMSCDLAIAVNSNGACGYFTNQLQELSASQWKFYRGATNGACSSATTWIFVNRQALPYCPAFSHLESGQCVCDVGATLNPQGDGCMVDVPVNLCEEIAGKYAGSFNVPGPLGAKQLCDTGFFSGDVSAPGCRLAGDCDFAATFDGQLVCGLKMYATGEKCVPDPAGSYDPGSGVGAPGTGDDAASTPCSPPLVAGTVNGQTVCVPVSSETPVQTQTEGQTTTTDSAGTTTGQTRSTETVCSATTCTTTTTITTTVTPEGGAPTTSTATESGTCTRGTAGCGPEEQEEEPSRFGGSCGTAFVCDGDAIFCAIAQEQHRRNCSLFSDSSSESQLYEAEKGKTGAQYTSEAVALGAGSFSQANALGGAAQCISDKVVTVWNQQVTLPFSQVCGTLQHLGTVLLFVSFLLAYRIVSRG